MQNPSLENMPPPTERMSPFGIRILEREGDPDEEVPVQDFVLPATDFSEGVAELHGPHGWFTYMERRMTARRPTLVVFQQKVMMKQLMMERGAPIAQITVSGHRFSVSHYLCMCVGK